MAIYPAQHYLSSLPPAAHDRQTVRAAPYTLAEAYAICRALTRHHSKSFFLAAQLLPPAKRRAIEALYAFCRTSDDAVDTTQGAEALADWVASVTHPAPPSNDPVLVAWADTCEQYDLPFQLVCELLAGVAMDLSVHHYDTFDELWVYCYRVASVVGLLTMRIVGFQPGADGYAIRLGVALQLTNILRDVGEDARRGRVYLPREDLERFGLDTDDILAGVRDRRFQALMSFEIAQAEDLYRASWPGILLLNKDGQMAVATAMLLYRGILQKIVANDFDVYGQRAYLSLGEKLRMLPRIRYQLHWLRRGDTALR